jgi:hypothetical protein
VTVPDRPFLLPDIDMRITAFTLLASLLAAPALASDATVSATDGTNELGYLRCAALATASASDCPYEMLRKEDGSATLRVLFPGGQVRYVYFENGKATGTDSTDSMTAETLGDELVIYIGPEERIELPMRVLAPGG